METGHFIGCDITSLILPSTVKSLGHKVFQACDSWNPSKFPPVLREIQTDTFDEYFDADANEGSRNVTFAGAASLSCKAAFSMIPRT